MKDGVLEDGYGSLGLTQRDDQKEKRKEKEIKCKLSTWDRGWHTHQRSIFLLYRGGMVH